MSSLKRDYSRFAYAFLALFALLALLGMAYSAHREKAAQLAFQTQRIEGSVMVVEDQITQTLQLIENLVRTLPDLSDVPLTQAGPAELTRLLWRLQLGQHAVRSLSVMTQDHVIKASTHPANVGLRVSLDGFVPPDVPEAAGSVLRMGRMWQGRDVVDGRPAERAPLGHAQAHSFLPLAFRLGSQSEAVWVLVALNTDHLLSRMERYRNIESDHFSLLRFDGERLLESGGPEIDDASWTHALSEMRQQEIGTWADSHLVAYRASSRYPFFFVIHVDPDLALASWREGFQRVVYWTLLALMLVLGVMLLLLRQVHASEKIQQQQQVELALSRDRAEAATQAKSQFLATMSHEIRTPLNGVIGMTELLASSPLTAEQQELLRVLQSSGWTLQTLIDDILDFSKIEVGKLELEHIDFDLRALLFDLRDTFTLQAQEKNLRLVLWLAPNVPQMVQGDPTRLRQVFANLIANAIKFTHQGEVTIDVRRSDEPHGFEARVQDTGIGIGPEVQQRLFEAFTQANSSITREYGGSGLGLVISAMLVQLMGGRISLSSEVGRGSIFHFTFKAIEVAVPPMPFNPTPALKTDLGHLRVLLAEDHQINRLLVVKVLNRVNIAPDLACDGLQVLELVQKNHYDVILMDIQMPGMDGLTATRHIRSGMALNQPHIIALTANAFAEDRAHCFAVGMNDFISKPLRMERLLEALEKVTP